ncbi:4-amino-4-deoxy-L-arabinose transferase [Actinopolyspora xinjiangensis]|uniref:4-amino-4-deoxy-L-arabinose transferase n=1 Tax=Actinopolyspora xinjiangensis TaxID=405564 RepID=A0A1H0WCS0_9ACTN|nr:hypothetical protein [Actinopolyspora xinjiangensis]SDP88467.1 4-amino-4-deoxy-L-arabinose transferase [Actinopolyspora xinjiangensis]
MSLSTINERDHGDDPDSGRLAGRAEGASYREPGTRAKAGRLPGFLARRGPAWGIGFLSLLLSAAFVLVNLSYNAWNLIPPLDDSYIHLQYAKQFAEGQFLRYNIGDPISTGASSLLYMIVLGGLYTLGLHGTALLTAAMVLGGVCMALTAVCVYRIGANLINRRVGVWAGLLVATNGVLLWGSASGMEIGFVALMVSGTVLAYTSEAPRGRFVRTPIIAFFTALTRPEAFIFVLVLAVAMAWTTLRGPRPADVSRARVIGRLTLLPLPLVAYLGESLLYKITTGHTSANGMRAKSLLYEPILYPMGFLDETLNHFHQVLRVLTGFNTFDFVFPGTLLLAVAGTIYLLVKKSQWAPLALALGIGYLLVAMAISTLSTATIHHLRYHQPFLPVVLLLAVVGVHGLSRLVRSRRNRRIVLNAGLVTALLFTVAETPSWAIRLGQQAAGIRGQQVSFTDWLEDEMPEDAVLAVNDVGAPAYLGSHRVVDLIGLTTNRFTEANNHGAGSIYEVLRDMPPEERPDYFAVFTNWPVHDLANGGVFGDEPLATFRSKSPTFSHRTVGSAGACQASKLCDEVAIYKADWSLVNTGDEPVRSEAPGRIRDHVNVADLDSEQRHDYEVLPAHRQFQPLTNLRTVNYPRGEVVDSGRHVIGGETVTARNLTPGEPVTITSRYTVSGRSPDPLEMSVSVDGEKLRDWTRQPGDNGWNEATLTVPGELVTDSTLRIEFEQPSEFLGPYPDYTSYGYWFSQ